MSSARDLLAHRLDPSSRVLLLGAGGWFGTTILDLIERSECGAAVLPITARPRQVTVSRRSWELQAWDWEVVRAFEPTVVVNCAFLTREKVRTLGYDRFVGENVRLTGRFIGTLEIASVRAALTVSSGAAVAVGASSPDADENPYGYLKWAEEIAASSAAKSRGIPLVVCRAWSVSGEFVQRPRDYAFSDLVLQAARRRRLRIDSGHGVWRRYVSAHDLLGACASLALDGWTGTVDSGGPLVEIGELAAAVACELAPGATIERPERGDEDDDRYYSDDRSWQETCARLGLVADTLEEQIRTVARGLARATRS